MRAYPGKQNILVPGGIKNNCYFLSSGERNGNSPNSTLIVLYTQVYGAIKVGGYKAVISVFISRRVTKYFVSGSIWEDTQNRVIVPYAKAKYLFFYRS